jgi:hypothetical protein
VKDGDAMKGTIWGRHGRGGGYAYEDRRRRHGLLLPVLMGLLFLSACGGGPVTGTPLPGATVVSGGRTSGTACVGGGCQPTMAVPSASTVTATSVPPTATPALPTVTVVLTVTPTSVPPTVTPPLPTVTPPVPTTAPTAARTPAVAPAGQILPGYPEDLYISREVTVVVDGTPVIVGISERYLGDPQVEEVVRAFLQIQQITARAFATNDESLLATAVSGPELERELAALRKTRDQGQAVQLTRDRRRIAVATIQGDKAGLYVNYDETAVLVDARSGQVVQRLEPREREVVVVIEKTNGVWKLNDGRSLR